MTTKPATRRTRRTPKTGASRTRIVLWIAAGFLLILGLNAILHQVMIAQVRNEPLMLDVPVIQQSLGTSCGEAVIALAYNFAHPESPISEAQVIDYAAAQGYFTEAIPPYTSPANMVKIARQYAAQVSSGVVSSPDQGLSLLVQHLRRGEPVIIDVLSNFNDPESEAHFIVVTGISVDVPRGNTLVIHYNDPLTGTRETDDWLGEGGVWNAWIDNGDPGGPGWWLVISPQ